MNMVTQELKRENDEPLLASSPKRWKQEDSVEIESESDQQHNLSKDLSETPVPTELLPSENFSDLDAQQEISETDNIYSTQETPELVAFKLKYCMQIIRNLKKLKDVHPFLVPVDPIKLGIPDYLNIIKNPMDLSTIQRKLETGVYTHPRDFIADVELMLNNAYLFNGPHSVITRMGQNVERSFRRFLEKMPTEIKHEKKKRTSEANSFDSGRPKRQSLATHYEPSYSPVKRKTGKKNYAELKFCSSVLRELMHKKYAAFNFPFLVPVDPIRLGIPHYTQIIKHPMDLSTVRRKLDTNQYENADDFESDVRLMLNNCFTFNRPGDEVYEMGRQLEAIFDEKMKEKPLPQEKPDDDSSDEEYDNQQIALLQKNLAVMSNQLAMLMEKRRKRKERRKNEMVDVIPDMSYEQKRELSDRINYLSPEKVGQVFQIIRDGMPALAEKAGEEEIELDINLLDKRTLYRLWKYVIENTTKAAVSNESINDEPEGQSRAMGLGGAEYDSDSGSGSE